MKVLLITGTRTADQASWGQAVRNRIEAIWPDRIVHGGAVGVDSIAEGIANELGIPTTVYPYPRNAGRAGGPIRNAQMVADLVSRKEQGEDVFTEGFSDDLAKSAGTRDCLKRSDRAGIPTNVTNRDNVTEPVADVLETLKGLGIHV